jgi:hypothetical protein
MGQASGTWGSLGREPLTRASVACDLQLAVRRPAAILPISILVACGAQTPAPVAIEPLDPTQSHYGKSNAEWAATWAAWVYQWHETAACTDPITDQTGVQCTFAQDPASPVFFLVGNFGGVSRRPNCVVPAGKALGFPILASWNDNGGVPLANQKTDAQLKAGADAQFQAITDVHLTLDGHVIEPLTPYGVDAAPYSYTLPPEPNVYTCTGTPGVTGTYAGYASGYFVVLPPLAKGAHDIAFSGTMSVPGSAPFSLDVEYSPLTVE